MPAGRPTAYKPEYAEQAQWLCRLGATVAEMAEHFGVATSTVSKWLKEIPEFSEAVKEGRVMSDARVANSLYCQALEGNTTAAIFWLKNRRSKDWRDKQEVAVEGQVTFVTDLTAGLRD